MSFRSFRQLLVLFGVLTFAACDGDKTNVDVIVGPSDSPSITVNITFQGGTTIIVPCNGQPAGTIELRASISPETSPQGVVWTSSDQSVATVSSSGTVTAVSAGSVTIRATSTHDESKHAEVTITVVGCVPQDRSIELVPGSGTGMVGSTMNVVATCRINGQVTTACDPYFYSTQPSNVSVGANTGLVRFIKVGSATVCAQWDVDEPSPFDCGEFTSIASNPSVQLMASPMNILLGESSRLTWVTANADQCLATASPASGEWTGTKPVQGSQLVTPTVTTTYSITCSGPGGQVNASVTVDVTVSPTQITVAPPSLNLYMSQCSASGPSTGQLTVSPAGTSVTWTSLNPGIATVNSSGKVTAVSPGSTTIRVMRTNGQGQPVDVPVTVNACPVQQPTITGVTLTVTPSTVTACPTTITIQAVVSGTGAFNPNAILNVSSGTVTSTGTNTWTWQATQTGSVTFTATAVGDPSKTVTRTVSVNCPVVQPPAILFFSASPEEIFAGQSSTLAWDTDNLVSCAASGAWSGSKPISGTQVVSPTSTSNYTLTCMDAGGSTISRTVTVKVNQPQAHSINVTPNTFTCAVGGQVTLSAFVQVDPGASTAVTWQSSNPSVATVGTQVGNAVTANCVSVGTVSITATSVENSSLTDTSTGQVVTGNITCTWTPSSGLHADGSVDINKSQTVSVTGSCQNQNGATFMPYWYSSDPAIVGVQGSQSVTIGGNTYAAGTNATITGVWTGQALITIQAAISQTSPAFSRIVRVH